MRRDLQALAEREHDLLVIGGGIYGACCAWDATQRGLRVALIEAHDFASGVSWNSLKTIHGGLRYLQTLDFVRMRESIRERRALLRIAPQLVKPLAFAIAAYGHGVKGREALALGLLANELVSCDRNAGLDAASRIPVARLLSLRELRERFPALLAEGVTGGALYYDAQTLSAERLVLAFLHTASAGGATVVNHASAEALLQAGSRLTGARVKDCSTGVSVDVRARLTINAAGPGCARLLAPLSLTVPRTPLLQAYNLVLRRPIVDETALGVRSGGRYYFAVPWRGHTLLGTGYEPADAPGAGWRGFLSDAKQALPWARLGEQDVSVVHAGLVPGESADRLASRAWLIDHARTDGRPGLLSLLGGKFTTARAVAERAVDLACSQLAFRGAACRTATTPLEMARALEGDLEVQARHAVREEQALTLADAVLRRMHLGTAGAPEAADLQRVAAVLSQELHWPSGRAEDEVSTLLASYPTVGRIQDGDTEPRA